MTMAEQIQGFLRHVPILPRRLKIESSDQHITISMLRGVWGAALHELDPVAYQAVFDPEGQNAVPGYLLRSSAVLGPSFEWFVMGSAVEHDESLKRAWTLAGEMGKGKERQPFQISEWHTLGPDGTNLSHSEVWPLSQARWPLLNDPTTTGCQLIFPPPLRLLRDKRLIEKPTLVDVVVALGRRVGAYLPAAMRSDWVEVCRQLIVAARNRPAEAWHGKRLDLNRWSARQEAEVRLRGVAGRLDLPRGPGDLWPLLAAGQWLHLGKGTVFGLGQLAINSVSPPPRGPFG